jgi:hypothetical protein
MQFWNGDNPVKASDGSDGQVRVVQQMEEGHSRSCAAVGVAKEEIANTMLDPSHAISSASSP